MKRMVKLYFLFSFVQRECVLALSTKCVIVGCFQSGSGLQNSSRAVTSPSSPSSHSHRLCRQCPTESEGQILISPRPAASPSSQPPWGSDWRGDDWQQGVERPTRYFGGVTSRESQRWLNKALAMRAFGRNCFMKKRCGTGES